MPMKKTPEELSESREKSNANLLKGGPVENRFRSGRHAVENARKGGIKSQKKRKEKREFREILELVWGSRPDLSPRVRDQLIHYGLDPEDDDITNAVISAVAVVQKANRGDVRALEKVLEVLGQDPGNRLRQQELENEKKSLEEREKGFEALDEAFRRLHGDDL